MLLLLFIPELKPINTHSLCHCSYCMLCWGFPRTYIYCKVLVADSNYKTSEFIGGNVSGMSRQISSNRWIFFHDVEQFPAEYVLNVKGKGLFIMKLQLSLNLQVEISGSGRLGCSVS